MMPPHGGDATPDDPLAQTVLRALLYLRHGEGSTPDVAALITQLITKYTEDRMTAEQELDAAIAELKTAHAEERQAAVDAFARIEAKLDAAIAGMAELGDEKADVLGLVQDAKAAAADYAARHPSEPAPEPPPAG